MARAWKLKPSSNLTKRQMKDTEPWIRNKADELAVDNGCWFDPVRAAYMIWWVERYCRLYEGEGFAGKPCIMPSIADQPKDWIQIPDIYPEFFHDNGYPVDEVLDFYEWRMDWHNELFHSGYDMHWQFECHARIYGWARKANRQWQDRGINSVRRFRKARVWIPKKSGKTPSLGFNSLYLTFGDGEPGAKSFIAAKDGKQAGKVWDHAYMMLRQSPELESICDINRTTKRVLQLDTMSYFEPLSSSNKRTMDSKEGLNGNLLIDESHVVDRQFMRILRFAGISRAQALDAAFSTAGNDPESWGKEEWETGEAINRGEKPIDNFFHQSYHAPQDLTVAKMDEDPEHYIRMANPAIGHTIYMEEALNSWHEAKTSPMAAAEYFMYRLNVWMNSSCTWLASGVWAGCGGHEFDDEELENKQCVIGLDLARKFDLAAAVPTWRNKIGGVDQRFIFWCNEERIKTIAKMHPQILEWVDAGFIRVNKGDVTDLHVIKRDLREFINRNRVVGIVYDATYAEPMMQDLEGGEVGPDGSFTYSPLPIGIQPMSQGRMTQTGPVADYENDLRAKKIRHEDNPVATWQFGHAAVSEDKRGNRMIIKENRQSYRTVDGCQAAIMGRWAALDFSEWSIESFDYYEKNEVEFI